MKSGVRVVTFLDLKYSPRWCSEKLTQYLNEGWEVLTRVGSVVYLVREEWLQ